MKTIKGYLLNYFHTELNKKYFFLIIFFTGLMVYTNYYVCSETQFIAQDFNPTYRLYKYFGEYLLLFGGAYLLQFFIYPKDQKLRSPKLWILILFSVLAFTFRAWFYQHAALVSAITSPAFFNAGYMIGFNLTGFVFLFLPCFVYWFFYDKNEQSLYGMQLKNINFKPYFGLLLMMIPLLLWASTQPDFKATYPRAHYLNLPFDFHHKNWVYLLYEICYCSDFFVTEFFFRGFLILAFVRYVDSKAILPMCAFYVAIHFDKPMAEAISSFFGGLVLGIIVYKTKSIWGGVIVHLGIALLMEIIGFLSN